METLKAQLERLREQVGALTVSQKMLVASLVTIMVMTMYFWGRYAGEAEMTPLFAKAVAPEDLARITSHLTAKGIQHRTAGSQVYVPVERKLEIIAELGFDGVLQNDAANVFEAMLARSSILSSAAQHDRAWNVALQTALSQVLQRFPGVARAVVIIDPTYRRGFNNTSVQPSATVLLNMKSGHTASSQLVKAAREMVSGAVAPLRPERVSVSVDGKPYAAPQPGSAAGDEFLERLRAAEEYYKGKVAEHLAHVPRAHVSVSVALNTKSRKSTEHKVDPAVKINETVEEDASTEEGSTGPRGGGEPGVLPNTGMSAAGSAGGESSATSSEKSRRKMIVDYARTDIHETDPGGDFAPVGVSVWLPRSYFAAMVKPAGPSGPPEEMVETVVGRELPKYRASIMKCLALEKEEMVHVDAYADEPAAWPAAEGVTTAGFAATMGSHAKEIAVGALALMSLFMVSMLVRRGAPSATAGPAPRPPTRISGEEEVLGEAGTGSAVLNAVEVDEEAVRTQQMQEQVASMVKEDPDAAAAMVRRWLNKA